MLEFAFELLFLGPSRRDAPFLVEPCRLSQAAMVRLGIRNTCMVGPQIHDRPQRLVGGAPFFPMLQRNFHICLLFHRACGAASQSASRIACTYCRRLAFGGVSGSCSVARYMRRSKFHEAGVSQTDTSTQLGEGQDSDLIARFRGNPIALCPRCGDCVAQE